MFFITGFKRKWRVKVEKKKTDEVTVWAWDPKFNIAALEIAKDDYKKENRRFNVNVIENAQDDIVQKLNTALGSGTTKGLPNIVLIEDYQSTKFLTVISRFVL